MVRSSYHADQQAVSLLPIEPVPRSL
jgi:hypothetical protein